MGNRVLGEYEWKGTVFGKPKQGCLHLVLSLQVAALEPLCKVTPAACSLHGTLPIVGAGRYNVCPCFRRLVEDALLTCRLLMLRLACLKYLQQNEKP